MAFFSIVGAGMLSLGTSFFYAEEFREAHEQLIIGIILCLASVVLVINMIIGKLKKKQDKEKTTTNIDSEEDIN